MAKSGLPVPIADITRAILVLRGHKVLLDSDLASLYGVTTKRFKEQVRRNLKRFPADFMFPVTAKEVGSLRSQFASLKLGRGQHRKYRPYAFTEHGAIMAATILNSPRAVEMNDSTNLKPDSIKSSRATTMPSPPFSRPSVNS